MHPVVVNCTLEWISRSRRSAELFLLADVLLRCLNSQLLLQSLLFAFSLCLLLMSLLRRLPEVEDRLLDRTKDAFVGCRVLVVDIVRAHITDPLEIRPAIRYTVALLVHSKSAMTTAEVFFAQWFEFKTEGTRKCSQPWLLRDKWRLRRLLDHDLLLRCLYNLRLSSSFLLRGDFLLLPGCFGFWRRYQGRWDLYPDRLSRCNCGCTHANPTLLVCIH
jgi:hypothetical protein